MKALVLMMLTVACSAAAASSESYVGDWKQTDLAAMQVVPPGCTRLWFTERSYALRQPSPPQGFYTSIFRAAPVGGSSILPNCKFPAPASNPGAMQIRGWAVVMKSDGNGGQRVAAEPVNGTGDLKMLETKEFATVLRLRDGRLYDGDPGDAANMLVFEHAVAPPAPARELLETTVARLEGGECLEVITSLGRGDVAAQMCEVRRRMAAIAGSYTGLSIISATPFDRISDRFPLESKTFERRRGVHYSFFLRYEKQKLVADALLVEEGGKWRIAYLWF